MNLHPHKSETLSFQVGRVAGAYYGGHLTNTGKSLKPVLKIFMTIISFQGHSYTGINENIMYISIG